MGDTPWQGDACSLVEAFRRGERTPLEELEATSTAVAASALNAVSYQPTEAALAAAAAADVSKPFGGVPVGVKELDHVTGWPATNASVVFADEVAGQPVTWSSSFTPTGTPPKGFDTSAAAAAARAASVGW